MPINSRRKGKNGELEAFRMLSDELGIVVRRNYDQPATGGADSISIPGWAIEVKRCNREEVEKWWGQAVQQAELLDARPLLLFRSDRRPWQAAIALYDLSPDGFSRDCKRFGILDFTSACQFIRSTL